MFKKNLNHWRGGGRGGRRRTADEEFVVIVAVARWRLDVVQCGSGRQELEELADCDRDLH